MVRRKARNRQERRFPKDVVARVDAPDAPVLSFLQKYDGEAIADRMRNDYLVVLGTRHDWRNFDQQYARFVLNDDTQVKCYALESRARAYPELSELAARITGSMRAAEELLNDLLDIARLDGRIRHPRVLGQPLLHEKDGDQVLGNGTADQRRERLGLGLQALFER